MKLRKFSICVVFALMCVALLGGCSRAVRDGISIGLTDGLSAAIAALVESIAASVNIGAG